MNQQKEVYELLQSFLKNDAMLGLGIVLIGSAVQLIAIQQYLYAVVFFVLAILTLGFRTFKKASYAVRGLEKKVTKTVKKSSPKKKKK